MDRVFSARVDEAVIRRIGLLARQLHISKKEIIERAISEFYEHLEDENRVDEMAQTFGAWKRDESPDDIREEARKAFRQSMERRHR